MRRGDRGKCDILRQSRHLRKIKHSGMQPQSDVSRTAGAACVRTQHEAYTASSPDATPASIYSKRTSSAPARAHRAARAEAWYRSPGLLYVVICDRRRRPLMFHRARRCRAIYPPAIYRRGICAPSSAQACYSKCSRRVLCHVALRLIRAPPPTTAPRRTKTPV